MAGVYLTGTIYLPDELIATVRTRVNRQPKTSAIHGFVDEWRKASTISKRADARVIVASAVANTTITCSSSAAVNDTDTLTIAGGTALAVKASPTTEDQVSKGTTDAGFAANVAAKINAHSVHSKLVWAAVTTAASGIVTVYCIYPGPIGNKITLAKVGNGFTLGASALANGASDAVKQYQLGYNTAGHVTG